MKFFSDNFIFQVTISIKIMIYSVTVFCVCLFNSGQIQQSLFVLCKQCRHSWMVGNCYTDMWGFGNKFCSNFCSTFKISSLVCSLNPFILFCTSSICSIASFSHCGRPGDVNMSSSLGNRVSGFPGMRQYRLPVQGHVTRGCLDARGRSSYPPQE